MPSVDPALSLSILQITGPTGDMSEGFSLNQEAAGQIPVLRVSLGVPKALPDDVLPSMNHGAALLPGPPSFPLPHT